MLHKEPFIISPEMFILLKQLQNAPELEGFHLVGGTALALQLGHRNSIDLDLFTQSDFDSVAILDFLKKEFSFEENFNRKNTLIGFIKEIKVDLITHAYPLVNPPLTKDGITFLSKEDIAAMKLNSIINSGQRLKDFIDVYFLLEQFSIKDFLFFFETKYPNTNPLVALKALSYFGDIDESIDPPKLIKPLPLKHIKSRISNAVVNTNKVFAKQG